MSVRRLLTTALGMAVIALALGALTPPISETLSALRAPQRTADVTGSDVLVLHVVGLLAWLVWAWGALGLSLTAFTALPGRPGHAARSAVRRMLPPAARRAAAVALGIGLGIAPPAVGAALVVATPATATAEEVPTGRAAIGIVPDWPAPPAPAPAATTPAPTHRELPAAEAIPEWPEAPAAGAHVVVRGDCLWRIAERRLAADTGRQPSAADVAGAVHAWWQANVEVIGPDPDRLLPGQVLRPPVLP